MLLELNILNFALIEKLNISFGKGLNILTGETGAGKSILIDAINYVLGSKFNRDLIRTGEEKTYVEAIFTIENSKTEDVLKKYDIEYEDIIIISRVAYSSGRSIAKVNGKSVLMAHVKELSKTLLDIHGQHENQNLLDPSMHRFYLDSFGDDNFNIYLNEYKNQYKELQNIKNKILEIEGKSKDRAKIIDYLKFQMDEIDKCELKIGEDEQLEKRFSIISNSEKINNILTNSYEILYNNSQGNRSIYDNLSVILKDFNSIEDDIEEIKEVKKDIEEIYYNIESIVGNIRDLMEQTNYDPFELENINKRLFKINNCKERYGSSIEDILKYREKISLQYDELLKSSEIIEDLKLKEDSITNNMKSQCNNIHKEREKIALELEKKVTDEFKFLGLEKAVFKIDIVDSNEFTENGFDKIQFLISTNPGEPLKPLDKVVSGGELSRIMLALKTVFADKDQVPSIIFDEIDSGISGGVAQRVGEKMYSISNNHQVFCVTHLPQIACISDEHYVVSKKIEKDKTFTKIKKVNKKDKEFEIAQMLGGEKVTELALENSKELIEMSELKKIQLSK